jgi:hypothetical protein
MSRLPHIHIGLVVILTCPTQIWDCLLGRDQPDLVTDVRHDQHL